MLDFHFDHGNYGVLEMLSRLRIGSDLNDFIQIPHSQGVFQLRNEAFERLSGCTWKIPSSTDYGDACSGIREQ